MKCPHCGGALVRSKSWTSQGESISWQKPWPSWLKLAVPIWMWACMNCGRVTFYLMEKRAVIKEFWDSVNNGIIDLQEAEDAEDEEDDDDPDKGAISYPGGFQRVRTNG